MFDALFWLVLPVAALEGLRVVRLEQTVGGRRFSHAAFYGLVELVLLAGCGAALAPGWLIGLALVREIVAWWRDGRFWLKGSVKSLLIAAAVGLLIVDAGPASIAAVSARGLDESIRLAILLLVCAACAIASVPARMADEARETLVAPLALIAFVRIAWPLGADLPWFGVAVPIVAGLLGLVSALWLLSAGTRANHFDPGTLVSELVLCERGVLLSFVWMGLACGAKLAGIGALLAWWSGALALVALEASLRQRPLPKPMVFFALAMAVCLPGTIGFVAEDLLAHGLLELRPWLAAAFLGVSAVNAAGLYLAIVHIIDDLNERGATRSRPSLLVATVAGLSLGFGLVPNPLVLGATRAHEVITGSAGAAHPPIASAPPR